MAPPFEFTSVRAVIFAVSGAQLAFWLFTLFAPRSGLAPLDLVVLWLTVPAMFFGAQNSWTALGAGLTAASLVITLGLLMA